MKTINDFKEISLTDVLNNIRKDDGNAFLSINENAESGKIPISIKDIVAIEGMRLTCGSKSLVDYISPYSATIINKLTSGGFTIVGQTNLDEFANGSSGKTSYFGLTKHPFIDGYVPGGSSSGSAYAVGANLTPVSIGTDTGGSVRQPAAFCGIYGLKPTYGRISRHGFMSLGSSLDAVGIFSNSVADMAQTLSTIAGYDENDPTSLNAPIPNYKEAISNFNKNRLTVGYLRS